MANTFLSKKIIVPAVIFFGGLLIASGILILANFTDAKSLIASQYLEWTQETGMGTSVPACESSIPSVTCVGNEPLVTFFYDFTGWGGYKVSININDVVVPIADNLPMPSGSFIWNDAENSTFYNYTVRDWSCTATEFGCIPDGGLSHQYTLNLTTINCVPAPTVSMTADPTTINIGGSSGLSWTSTNATSCSIDQGIGSVPVSDTISVSPSVDTTYTITCSGPTAPPAQSSALVTVIQSPGDFNLSPPSATCNSVSLSWTASSGADGYRILKGAARIDITPYNPYTALNFVDYAVNENTTYLYQIEAYNTAGTNRSNTRNKKTPYCPPTLDFSGDPTIIYEGQISNLIWSSTFTTSCTASGAWSGSKGLNGNEIVIPLPPPSVTYNLQCSGPGGTTPVQPVTITITPLGLPGWKEIIPR